MRIQTIGQELRTNNKQNYNRQPAFRRNWSEHVSWGANYVKETGKTNFKLFSFPDAKAVFVEVADKVRGSMGKLTDRLVSIVAATGIASAFSSIDEKSELYPMENKGDGVFEANNIEAKAGDSYRFVVVTKNNDVNLVKDPYSKEQKDILGWSTVNDPNSYKWENTGWLEGKDPRRIVRKPNEPMRGLENLIIEEINISTSSQEGTFEAAKTRIDKIAQKGFATAIELMPLENTNSLEWGYDGVDKFAPNSKMGKPDELKELIDYAHGKGLNVIMDMVPNHMGPDGDLLSQTGDYIKLGKRGNYGNLLNYEGKNGRYVRDWMVNAALNWANNYKVDGLRFDLTSPQFTGSDYLLKQISLEVNKHNPDVFLIAEDHQRNRHTITAYNNNPNVTHNQEVEYYDKLAYDRTLGWGPIYTDIGFDSEWDSLYREPIQKQLAEKNTNRLDQIDNYIDKSHYRIKYAYSHDEIGNEDGTRLISKAFSDFLDLYFAIDDSPLYNKGQKVAKTGQELLELLVSKDFDKMSEWELRQKEEELGLKKFFGKQQLIDAYNGAFAKQKLAFGTIMTTPGPKMYFQGDDEADLSYFKFFRELSDDKKNRSNPDFDWHAHIIEKGYDQLESIARPDSIVGRVKYHGIFKDKPAEMTRFTQDLKELFNSMPVLSKGAVVAKYKDNNHKVHSHLLKLNNDEVLVIKNFGQGFHNTSYEYYGFPQNSQWEEIFNSDDIKYGGMGYVNTGRKDINNFNQHLSLAPNSFLILRKIG